MNIQFVDLKSQYASIESEVTEAISKVLVNGDYILGKNVSDFEQAFATYCGFKYAVGVSDGTTSIELGLKAMGVGLNDHCITVANTFVATPFGINAVGAFAHLVDCDENYLIDLKKLEDKIIYLKSIGITTKVIVPVSLYGQLPNFEAIEKIADKWNMKVLHDGSQSHGATFKGKRNFGDIACMSLYPAKNFSGITDGGVICTDNEDYYKYLIKARNYGSDRKYYHDFVGRNSRLDTINAGVLLVKLKYLDKWNRTRNDVANLYDGLLRGIGDLILPKVAKNNTHVWHLYVIRTKYRDELQKFLADKNIPTVIHYPVSVNNQKCYEGVYNNEDYPLTNQYANEILSLPIHPHISLDEVGFVVNTIKNFFDEKKSS